MKNFITAIFIFFSIEGIACSCGASMGFCQNIEGDTSLIVLGVKLNDYFVYDNAHQQIPENALYVGMAFKLIETLRGTILEDTITVWSEEYHSMCDWGTRHFFTGDTILIKLRSTYFSIDSMEQYVDYEYLNGTFCFKNFLIFREDTLRGLVYEDYRDFPVPFLPYHSDVFYKIRNVAYADFKTNIESGLVCYDYTSVEEKYSIAFSLYPNPCENKLHFNLPVPVELNISIFDITGRRILYTILRNENSMDVSMLHPGIYFLRMEKEGKSETVKFVKR